MVNSHILAWKNIYNSKHLKTFHLLTSLVFKSQVTGKAGGFGQVVVAASWEDDLQEASWENLGIRGSCQMFSGEIYGSLFRIH